MKRLIITIGLMASGKSGYACDLVKKDKSIRRVERDELRKMLFGQLWTGRPEDEKLVTELQVQTITHLAKNNYSVIVSDTNLDPKTRNRLKALAKTLDIQYEENDSFLKVSVDECVKRDAARANSVGEKVIRSAYDRYLRPKVEPYKYKAGLPFSIIVDLDGTLALLGNRNPYDSGNCGTDTLNEPVKFMMDAARREGIKIVIFSGREDKFLPESKTWLDKHNVKYDLIRLRKTGDFRKDNEVKLEMFNEEIRDKYNVKFVLDDRNQVVELYRKDLQLPCFQVNDGDF